MFNRKKYWLENKSGIKYDDIPKEILKNNSEDYCYTNQCQIDILFNDLINSSINENHKYIYYDKEEKEENYKYLLNEEMYESFVNFCYNNSSKKINLKKY